MSLYNIPFLIDAENPESPMSEEFIRITDRQLEKGYEESWGRETVEFHKREMRVVQWGDWFAPAFVSMPGLSACYWVRLKAHRSRKAAEAAMRMHLDTLELCCSHRSDLRANRTP